MNMDGVFEIMKKLIIVLAAILACSPAFAGTIKLSSTIGPVDAGIIPLLAETWKAKNGTEFVIEKAGTGATLNKAKSGNFARVPLRIASSPKVTDRTAGTSCTTISSFLDLKRIQRASRG